MEDLVPGEGLLVEGGAEVLRSQVATERSQVNDFMIKKFNRSQIVSGSLNDKYT